jgi:hypothetical protein
MVLRIFRLFNVVFVKKFPWALLVALFSFFFSLLYDFFRWLFRLCTANKFGIMYSRIWLSQNLFPNFIYIFLKVIHDILSGTTRSQKELWKPDLNLGSQGCLHEKNFSIWIWTWDPCISIASILCHWTIKADTLGSRISILVPFRTTEDSFLPVTFTGLGDLFPQLGSSQEQLFGDPQYLALVVQCKNTYNCCRGPGFGFRVRFLYFFMLTSLGDKVQIWFS